MRAARGAARHLARDWVHNQIVMPAKAGIQGTLRVVVVWTPAFAGVTVGHR